MKYTEDEIKRYLSILEENTKKNSVLPPKSNSCCQNPNFIIWSGYNLCENCCTTSGHVLGYFDTKEYGRFHFQKKSVYQPKYYYEKKVDQISNIIELSDEEKSLVYDKLIKIDEKIKEQLNKQFGRKRLINIFYLIKKILEEMGSDKSEEIYLKISKQTLKNYDNWWKNYNNLRE